MVAPINIASPANSHDSDARAAHGVRDAAALNNVPARGAAPSAITPRQRWAHNLVLDMLKANLPLSALAAHLNIPFLTLIDYINAPEVQAEIDAYESLINLRARLLGESARPISLRKLLDVLESPAPKLTGRDPDADTRALHRHAELIRRTATTIARESRALAPTPPRASKSSPRTASVSKQTLGPSNGEPSNAAPSGATSSRRVPKDEPELVRDAPSPPTPSPTPGRTESRARQSPTDALRAAAGSTHVLRDPSRRSRDRPAA